jgi:NAD(P)-dependent dehydrogenase (short-subunit alcohol dehydrogenase family)
MGNNPKIALVTGANKGLGFEISRQLAKQGIRVLLGARDLEKGKAAAAKLQQEGLDVQPIAIDISNPESIESAIAAIKELGGLDILINNAGVLLEDWSTPVSEISLEIIAQTLQTNFYGALSLCQAIVPMMKAANYGRIVNMSSTLGSLADAGDPNSHYAGVGSPAYRLSKTILNSVTVLFAKELRGTNVLINSACPGWVQTDMGSSAAALTVEQGADTPVWLATLPDDGANGGFFNSRQPISW